MNTMKYGNMNGYLDESSSEVIISKITGGKSFHPAHIDLLKKEIDGYLKLSKPLQRLHGLHIGLWRGSTRIIK